MARIGSVACLSFIYQLIHSFNFSNCLLWLLRCGEYPNRWRCYFCFEGLSVSPFTSNRWQWLLPHIYTWHHMNYSDCSNYPHVGSLFSFFFFMSVGLLLLTCGRSICQPTMPLCTVTWRAFITSRVSLTWPLTHTGEPLNCSPTFRTHTAIWPMHSRKRARWVESGERVKPIFLTCCAFSLSWKENTAIEKDIKH